MRISHVCFSANHLWRASRTSVGKRNDLSIETFFAIMFCYQLVDISKFANALHATRDACRRIREENPQLWEAYLQNKGNSVRKP